MATVHRLSLALVAVASAAAGAASAQMPARPAAPPPVSPDNITVVGRRLKGCGERDVGCINAVAQEVWRRYPEQVKDLCAYKEMDAARNRILIQDMFGTENFPLDGYNADTGLPPALQRVCNYKDDGRRVSYAQNWLPWRTVPSEADLASVYPAGVPGGGAAEIYCGVNAQGRLTHCSLSHEEPEHKGFGRAALRLAGKFSTKVDAGVSDAQLHTLKVDIAFQFDDPQVAHGARMVSSLDWTRLPDPARTAALYPAGALQAGVATGVGKVDCRVGGGGALGDCRVVEESPPGLGFGAAALAVAPEMRANLWTREGQSADGARVVVPLRFNAPSSAQGQ